MLPNNPLTGYQPSSSSRNKPENPDDAPLRLAAIGDVHCTTRSSDNVSRIFEGIHQKADVLLLCGDITDRGRITELDLFMKILEPSLQAGLLVIAILGNHDYQSGNEWELVQIMRRCGIRVLYGDDNIFVLNSRVGFAGVKGFWGGFSPNMVSAFGEKLAKEVLHETALDVRRLDKGLRSLSTPVKVTLLHYAPIKATLKGEPAELMNVLGNELLAKPLDDEGATICFHGHSHHGSYSGLTKKGVPVYNVAAPVLRRTGLMLPSIHTV